MFNPTCFTGDTEVYTSDGLVCIEDVQVGDSVWAYNSETGETELKEVLNVWVKETDEILHVSTSDGETIDTTTNHPFYVEEKGWVAAGDLEFGDTLVTADGDEVEVTEIELERLDEPILVYNLEVEEYHTYFVGNSRVLVHNVYKKGSDAEKKLVNMYPDGKSQSFFATSNGRRFIDRLSNKTAHEAKEGYTSATQFIKKQLKKDIDLLSSKEIDKSIWHFFESPVTGKKGPSQPLIDLITSYQQKGFDISYIIH